MTNNTGPSACDTQSGACAVTGAGESGAGAERSAPRPEIVYFGDPMCSWCWGIAPELRKLRRWSLERELPFRVVMGGLRPGGGEAWDARFISFLRHHWRDIAAQTGQTFNESLLSRDHFEYDTEPACRAVVTAQSLNVYDDLGFMSKVQYGFYVMNGDPKEPDFYRSICVDTGLDTGSFAERFDSPGTRQRTLDAFTLSRQAGIASFPTVLLYQESGPAAIATGFARFEDMRQRIENWLAAAS